MSLVYLNFPVKILCCRHCLEVKLHSVIITSDCHDKSIDWRMDSKNTWVVHKFGGTSVGSADCIRKCVNIVKPEIGKSRIAVVVSAMGGKPKVTDMLLDSVHAAANGNMDASAKLLQEIHRKHEICVNDILKASPSVAQTILNKIASDLKDINDLLRAVNLMKMAHEQILELVSGYGEVSYSSLSVYSYN